jgi:hypothetical protein
MISIRKFVGYAGAAAGVSAALTIAMSTQTAVALTQPFQPRNEPVAVETTQVTPSAGCTAAIQKLKAAFIADLSEDRAEYATAKLNGAVTEPDNDTTESAGFMTLWSDVRTACATGAATGTSHTGETNEGSEPATTHTFTPSAACTAAVQALKAAWAQRPTTQAQWQQMKTLAQAARTACGWSGSWTGTTGWSAGR